MVCHSAQWDNSGPGVRYCNRFFAFCSHQLAGVERRRNRRSPSATLESVVSRLFGLVPGKLHRLGLWVRDRLCTGLADCAYLQWGPSAEESRLVYCTRKEKRSFVSSGISGGPVSESAGHDSRRELVFRDSGSAVLCHNLHQVNRV